MDLISYRVDNRWDPGSTLLAAPPTKIHAHYSARWIDQGMSRPADIVPDRQGFAYDRAQYRDILGGELSRRAPHSMHWDGPESVRVVDAEPAGSLAVTICLRRAGGYVYCDAYLHEPVEVEPVEAPTFPEG